MLLPALANALPPRRGDRELDGWRLPEGDRSCSDDRGIGRPLPLTVCWAEAIPDTGLADPVPRMLPRLPLAACGSDGGDAESSGANVGRRWPAAPGGSWPNDSKAEPNVDAMAWFDSTRAAWASACRSLSCIFSRRVARSICAATDDANMVRACASARPSHLRPAASADAFPANDMPKPPMLVCIESASAVCASEKLLMSATSRPWPGDRSCCCDPCAPESAWLSPDPESGGCSASRVT
mmetsp:Transcript_48223/g.148791  ORF Transcript_48223/g.148791 Transcript_48223/m.148791 type:complete len:239 (-) Transcript_48223:862-1578(-)